ncbi:hypothetical protein H8D83_00895 [Candidatus Woesearchaeota archaeon]|nr:hypothetical protein [Candidatus Woesearchaeota archaeon]MBL7051315.1 hypothetical protein [Candidatus Woesearchaeota archaeon]
MKKDYFWVVGFLFLNLVGMVSLVFSLKKSFYLELFFFELFVIFAIVVSVGVYKQKKWGWPLGFIFFILFGFNLLFVASLISMSWLLFLLALLCLFEIVFSFMSMSVKYESEDIPDYEEHRRDSFYTEKEMRDIEKEFGIEPQLYKRKDVEESEYKMKKVVKKSKLKSKAKPKAKPKKKGFVASKNSTVYHVKSCAFAKRIKAKDKVVFNSKISASRKKYKAHSCVN